MTLKQVIYLFRPHTLPASLSPILVACALAYGNTASERPFSLLALLPLLTGLLGQIACNVANDYFDFKQGADREDRVGFARPLALGAITLKEVRLLLVITTALTAIVGLAALLLNFSWWIAGIGFAVIIGIFAYSTGPFPLAYHALGEVTVFLFYGLAATLGSYFYICGSIHWEAVVAAVCMGLASVNILIVNNYRDVDEDRRAHKRTLAVCFGKELMPLLYRTNTVLIPILCLPFYRPVWNLLIMLPFFLYSLRLTALLPRTEGAKLDTLLKRTAQGVLLLAATLIAIILIHLRY